MIYLVDSDWLIDALRGVPTAIDTLEALSADGLAVSIIAFGEIIEGAYNFPIPRCTCHPSGVSSLASPFYR